MTNGEKIKEIFPNFRINEMSHTVWVGNEAMSFKRDWWNAEYKEPTTKNDLGVDCISRIDVLDSISIMCSAEKLDIDFAKLLLLRRAIKALPSVTPQEPFINKLCVSSGVCEHDKNKVLDKIRAEIITLQNRCYALHSGTMCKHCPYECEYKTDKEIEDGNDD